MPTTDAAVYYRRRERQERAIAAQAGTLELALPHLELADGYRVLAEQVEEHARPAMRRMEARTPL